MNCYRALLKSSYFLNSSLQKMLGGNVKFNRFKLGFLLIFEFIITLYMTPILLNSSLLSLHPSHSYSNLIKQSPQSFTSGYFQVKMCFAQKLYPLRSYAGNVLDAFAA